MPEYTTTSAKAVDPYSGGKEGTMITLLITVVAVVSITVTITVGIKRR